MAKAKQDALKGNIQFNDLIAKLDKKLGVGTIILGKANTINVNFISTGIVVLDARLGGGIPRGRIVELFGAEGSGKTTTALEIVSSCQKTFFKEKDRFGVAAFIDAEHALDPNWAKGIGVNIDNMLINQPNSGEEGIEVIDELAKSGLVDLIIVDSVASLIPEEELNGEVTDTQMGAQARMISKGLRRITGPLSKSGTTVIFINQLRQKIGQIFGNPEVTPGGRALKFGSSIRIDVRKGTAISVGDKTIGHQIKIKIVKNKVGPPFQSCEFDVYFVAEDGHTCGVDKVGALFDTAVSSGVIKASGSWYAYGNDKLGLGRLKSVAVLRDNADMRSAIENTIMGEIKTANGPNLRKASDEELIEQIELSDEGCNDGS